MAHIPHGLSLDPSSAGSQSHAAYKSEGRNDLSNQTAFRLHILGKRNWNPSQVDEEEAEKLVRKAFDVENDTEVIIKSLADHPVRRAVVATLNFSRIPTKISQTSILVHEFEEPVQGLSVSLDTHFHGFTPVHHRTSSEYECDFVALSGLGGHAFGSFKCRGGDYMWLRDDLPFSVPDSRSFIYGYNTELHGSTSFQSLYDLGLAFKDALKSLRSEDLKNGVLKPLIFLGHSLGGLVLKEALCDMSTSPGVDDRLLLKSIRAILFFGTPNQGIDIKSLIPMVEGQANEDFLRSLRTDSVDLQRQARQWSEAFDSSQSDLISTGLEIISYYETSNSPTAVKVDGKWKMSGPSTTLVDRSSATHGRPWETKWRFVQPISRDHSGLVKFRTRNDHQYVDHVLWRLQSYSRLHMHMTDEQTNSPPLKTCDQIFRQNHQSRSVEEENSELKATVKSLEEALQMERHKTQDLRRILTENYGHTHVALDAVKRDKLVIGLEFGVEFSRVAYAVATKPEQVFCIDTWPGSYDKKFPEAPTVIKYDEKLKTGLKWGWKVDPKINRIHYIPILLEPEYGKFSGMLGKTLTEMKNSSKDATQITGDYINAIFQHALQQIKQSFLTDDLEGYEKEYVISMSALSSDTAKDKALLAAGTAKFSPITMVEELEAAALYTLHFNRGNGLQVGDAIVVCDAGYSTVDIISYEIMDLTPLELEEIIPRSGGIEGSTRLEQRVCQRLINELGMSAFDLLTHTLDFRLAMQSFEYEIKPGFCGRDDDKLVSVPIAKLKDRQWSGSRLDSIDIPRETLLEMFDTLIRDIDKLVTEQLDKVHIKRLGHLKGESVKAIFLVGSFGSSIYLKQAMEKSHPGIQILQPPEARSAMVKGAVLSKILQ